MWGNTWDLEYCGNINGNYEAGANKPSLTRDSCHSRTSEGTGVFYNTRYGSGLMPAFPLGVLCCAQNPQVLFCEFWKVLCWKPVTDCFQEVSWHPPTAVERAFSITVSLERGGLPSYHYIMCSQQHHSLWKSLLFHMLKFCLPNQTHLQDLFNEMLQFWSFNIKWRSNLGKKITHSVATGYNYALIWSIKRNLHYLPWKWTWNNWACYVVVQKLPVPRFIACMHIPKTTLW